MPTTRTETVHSILKYTLLYLAFAGQFIPGHAVEEDTSRIINHYTTPSDHTVAGSSFTSPQAAINFAAKHKRPVTFVGMKIVAENTIILPSNTHIIGGYWIILNNGNRLFENSDTNIGNNNIRLQGMTVDGEHRSFGQSNGIHFQKVDGIEIYDCTIKRMHSGLTSIIKFNPLRLVDCSNIAISNNRMLESARSGIFIDGASKNVLVQDNIINQVENAGIAIKGTYSDGSKPMKNIIISGNIIVNAHNGSYDQGYTGNPLYNQDGAIDVYQGGENILITSNIIDGFGIFGTDEQATPGGQSRNLGHGIRLTQCIGAVVNGNTLTTNEAFDICLYASTRNSFESKGIIFSNNSIIVRGRGGRGLVTHQSKVTLIGNHFRNDNADARFLVSIDIRGKFQTGVMILNNLSDVPNTLAGIRFEGSALECQVRGNRVENCVTGLLTANDKSVTRCHFENNTFPACHETGIDLRGIVEACSVSGNIVNAAGGTGIRLEQGRWCKVMNNHVEGAGKSGIVLIGAESSQIQGNHVIGSGQEADALYDNISVTGENLHVRGNTVHVGFSKNQPRFGIKIGRGSKDILLIDNFYKNGGKIANIKETENANAL